MEPGDVLLFHGDQVHGSEINSTDCTRHVISFRVVLEKPCYTHGHYHHYLHSKLAAGPLKFFAEIPQNLAWSYINYRVNFIASKLASLIGLKAKETPKKVQRSISDIESDTIDNALVFSAASVETGRIHAVSSKICVTRLENNDILAFGRYCTHQGADLSLGVVHDDAVICPWHNLYFNPGSGENSCKTLKKIKVFPCEVKDDKVYVSTTSV